MLHSYSIHQVYYFKWRFYFQEYDTTKHTQVTQSPPLSLSHPSSSPPPLTHTHQTLHNTQAYGWNTGIGGNTAEYDVPQVLYSYCTHTVLYSYCTVLAILYCTVLAILYCTVLTILYCTVLTILYCAVLTILYCTHCDVPQCPAGTPVENCTHEISGVVTPPGEWAPSVASADSALDPYIA
jgi:hypothetical protein